MEEMSTTTPACFEGNKLPLPGPDSDNRTLSVIDSERMRLLELLAVVNRRLDESRRQQTEAEGQLRKEKFKNAKLETKVAKLELERVGAMKTGRGSYSQCNVKLGETSLDTSDIAVNQFSQSLNF